MNSETIRRIKLDDLNRIYELEKICFTAENAYTKNQLKYLITTANSSCLAQTFDDIIRGFIIVLYKNKTRVAGVETLNVDPVFRGIGIGKKLLIAAEEEMFLKQIQKIRLEVSAGNLAAIKLYEKLGFKKLSILPSYYKYQYFGTNDAYRMIKFLSN